MVNEPANNEHPEDGFSDEVFREVFGVTRRQAQNLSDFSDRRRTSQQYERLGRAVVKKILYLTGALSLALWAHLDDRVGRILDWLLR